jgi:hypothetical protein
MRVLSFVGADNRILTQCSKKEQVMYRFFNFVLMVLIMAVAWEVYYMVGIIFENRWFAICAGMFWAFVFFNLYRFILYTITGKKGTTFQEKLQIIIPNGFKILIVVFFGFLITFPIELFLYQNEIKEKLPEVIQNKIEHVQEDVTLIYKKETYVTYQRLSYYEDQLFEAQEDILKQQLKYRNEERLDVKEAILENIAQLERQYLKKKESYQPIITQYKEDLLRIEVEKEAEISRYITMIKESKLLPEQFSILKDHKPIEGLILKLVVILIFIFPLLYKIYSLYKLDFLYERLSQGNIKHEIRDNYAKFKMKYCAERFQSIGVRIDVVEEYIDPPFNTQKK